MSNQLCLSYVITNLKTTASPVQVFVTLLNILTCDVELAVFAPRELFDNENCFNHHSNANTPNYLF